MTFERTRDVLEANELVPPHLELKVIASRLERVRGIPRRRVNTVQELHEEDAPPS